MFDRLPTDIRLQILGYLVPTNQYVDIQLAPPSFGLALRPSSWYVQSLRYLCGRRATLPILTVSKSISNDCLDLLYGTNAFAFQETRIFDFFFDAVGPHNLRRIKEIFYCLCVRNVPHSVAPLLYVVITGAFARMFSSLRFLHIGFIHSSFPADGQPPRRGADNHWITRHSDEHDMIVNSLLQSPGSLQNGSWLYLPDQFELVVVHPDYHRSDWIYWHRNPFRPRDRRPRVMPPSDDWVENRPEQRKRWEEEEAMANMVTTMAGLSIEDPTDNLITTMAEPSIEDSISFPSNF